MPSERKRAIYLRVDEVTSVDHWCLALARSFGTPPYLVGSVLERDNWRDVDVRVVLDDAAFAAIPLDVRDLNFMLSRW